MLIQYLCVNFFRKQRINEVPTRTGAIPAVAANAPDEAYNVEHFRYEAVGDYYVCPQGSELHTNGT